jgi:hypothetical protein
VPRVRQFIYHAKAACVYVFASLHLDDKIECFIYIVVYSAFCLDLLVFSAKGSCQGFVSSFIMQSSMCICVCVIRGSDLFSEV